MAESYLQRTYRNRMHGKNLVGFQVAIEETDLWIGAHGDVRDAAVDEVRRLRADISAYIKRVPAFKDALTPLPADPSAPEIVRRMIEAAQQAGVGPMAAVAGAIAEGVGRHLLQYSPEVIVENGGDLFIKSSCERTIGVFAGKSPFSDKLFLRIASEKTPLGICTSAGTVGPSLSFGRADAVVILSHNTALADAAATAIGNRILTAADIRAGIKSAEAIEGICGALIIIGDKLGVWGEIELTGGKAGMSS